MAYLKPSLKCRLPGLLALELKTWSRAELVELTGKREAVVGESRVRLMGPVCGEATRLEDHLLEVVGSRSYSDLVWDFGAET